MSKEPKEPSRRRVLVALLSSTVYGAKIQHILFTLKRLVRDEAHSGYLRSARFGFFEFTSLLCSKFIFGHLWRSLSGPTY